ncbi:hypothetical protein TNCV_68321 [Trichonephila clavipes]|nr:hypothetical protein TNCV_68321 [Trichonephila clavipes]
MRRMTTLAPFCSARECGVLVVKEPLRTPETLWAVLKIRGSCSDEPAQGRGKFEILTTGFGAPIADKLNSLTAGPRGPMLLQDVIYIEEMAHFNR